MEASSLPNTTAGGETAAFGKDHTAEAIPECHRAESFSILDIRAKFLSLHLS